MEVHLPLRKSHIQESVSGLRSGLIQYLNPGFISHHHFSKSMVLQNVCILIDYCGYF